MIFLKSLAIFLTLVILGHLLLFKRKNSSFPLPPGPKKLPIIGNLLCLPKKTEWLTYAKWGKEYDSGIIHMEILGEAFIIVNSHEIADELFEKRSSIYSSRPRLCMINELMGWNWLFALMPYGDNWKAHRKLFQREFHPTASVRHQPHELKAVREILQRLLDTPTDFMEHLRHMVGATIMSVAYGIAVQPHNDPYIDTAEKALSGMIEASVPGKFPVEQLPLLKYVPEWMPGANFKRKAREWREYAIKMVERPFKVVQREVAEGIAAPSFTLYCLENMDMTKDVENQLRVIKETAGNLYTAGSDTTVSALNTFILAMLCYPEVQATAQAELDRVLVRGHLPDFDDEPSLPYVAAIVKEVIRWQPVTPIAIPHYLNVDDEYNGYHIPANSVVIGNAWAMLHDERIYPKPETFNPDRWMKDGQLNPEIRDPTAVFGFGRRICPGRHMAISSLWITAASILSMFNITEALDEFGSPIERPREYQPKSISHIPPFKCNITPRSKEAEALIRL